MSRVDTPPDELVEWIEARADLLVKTAHRVQAKADVREDQQVSEWLLPLLADLAHAETIAKRAVHLLSAYALRHGVTTQTDVARATDLTVTAAANRAASRLARETWTEIWPESET